MSTLVVVNRDYFSDNNRTYKICNRCIPTWQNYIYSHRLNHDNNNSIGWKKYFMPHTRDYLSGAHWNLKNKNKKKIG